MTAKQKTFIATPEQLKAAEKWVLVDAAGATLGRIATQIAMILRGKHRPTFSPHQVAGDFVLVINAAKVHATGRKLDQKIYFRHTEYPGGIKQVTLRRLLETHPERAIEHAVKGMLPKNHMGRTLMTRLKVYAGDKHDHAAQQPKPLALEAKAKRA